MTDQNNLDPLKWAPYLPKSVTPPFSVPKIHGHHFVWNGPKTSAETVPPVEPSPQEMQFGGAFTFEAPRQFPDLKLLFEFAALSRNVDDLGSILRFADKHGCLGLCKHGLALGHRGRRRGRCYLQTSVRPRCELIAGWQRYIKRADGILSICSKLHHEKKATESDWSWLTYRGSAGRVTDTGMSSSVALWPKDTLENQRILVSMLLNNWLDECEIGIAVAWSNTDIDVRLGKTHPYGWGNDLISVIAVQLFNAVVQRDSVAHCAACGRIYKPERKPRAGELNYCTGCGRKAKNRNAQRARRARKKESENE